jgi:hypothetical protein
MTLILMACFGLRFALFLYRPITDEYLPKDVRFSHQPTWRVGSSSSGFAIQIFQTFAYYFPELVPVFMLSTIIIWSRCVRPLHLSSNAHVSLTHQVGVVCRMQATADIRSVLPTEETNSQDNQVETQQIN